MKRLLPESILKKRLMKRVRALPALLALSALCFGTPLLAAPTVSLTAPTDQASYLAPATLTLKATATPESGTRIGKVEFYQNDLLIGSDTTSPYSVSWTPTAAGSYSLTAKATDSAGGTTVSAIRTIKINAANTPPTVSLSAPANNAIFALPATITVNASASGIETNTAITSVAFYAGTTLIGSSTAKPYSVSWTPTAAGTVSLTAKATDSAGASTISAARTVTINAANTPPTVSLSAPANNAVFALPATITVSASASGVETNTAITAVEFYAGTTLIGSSTAKPYSVSWTPTAAGSYSLTAKATDSAGGTTVSAIRTIKINAANTPPTVSLSAPANNAVFALPATITVSASASGVEANTAITAVEFYAGTTLIGSSTAKPYSVSWTPTAAGSYSLTAKATDSAGASSTSAIRTIKVNAANTPPTVSLSAPANNAVFALPATITVSASASGVEANTAIASVAFYAGTTLIGSSTAKPYSVSWTPTAAGTYSLTAKATDSAGASTTSAVRSVVVKSGTAADGVYFIEVDHLETPRLISDQAGTTVWRWENSDPFGDNPPEEDPDGDGRRFEFNLRFPGQYYDRETGLHYNFFREYDPAIGRYTTSDPIGLAGGVNTYGYVGGNPLSRIDPKGLEYYTQPFHVDQPPLIPLPETMTFTFHYGLPQAPIKPSETKTYSIACILKLGIGFKGGLMATGYGAGVYLPPLLQQYGFQTMASIGYGAASFFASPVGWALGGIGLVDYLDNHCQCSQGM